MQIYRVHLQTLHLCIEAERKHYLGNLSKAQVHHTLEVCPIILQKMSKDKSLCVMEAPLETTLQNTGSLLQLTLHQCLWKGPAAPNPAAAGQHLPIVSRRTIMHHPSHWQ